MPLQQQGREGVRVRVRVRVFKTYCDQDLDENRRISMDMDEYRRIWTDLDGYRRLFDRHLTAINGLSGCYLMFI